MKINEVTHTVNKMNLDSAVKYLEERGYEELGSGIHAIVMHKPGAPYCVKIYDDDDCYTAFYQMCQKNWKSDPHLPRVYGMGKWMDRFGAVRLELLQPMQSTLLLGTIRSYAKGLDVTTKTIEKLEAEQPGITKTLDAIRAVKDAVRGSSWDIHGGNIMQREDGTLVITDPLAG